jgi:vancomycin aglycone glucosyltransferase
VSRGWGGVTIPDNELGFLSIEEVNLQALFKRVAAVVHHGGAGTITVAAQAGAPQLVVPQMYDQHYWALRVQQLGNWFRARAVSASVRADGAAIAARRLIREFPPNDAGNPARAR